MKVLRRKILLDDLKRFDDGVAYDTITATSIYMKVEMTQTIDDLGMVTNLPFIPNGAECAQFDGSIIVTNVTCYDPNSPAPSSAYINVTVYGGQAPYTYNFSAGTNPIFNVTTNNTNYMLQNLAAGSYSVEVVDNLGCVVSLAGISENLSDVVTPTGYVILGAEYTNEFGTLFPPGTEIPFTDITTTISVCEGTPVTLGINDPSNYTNILWSTNELTETIQVTQSGNYSVQASNGDCFGGTPEVNIEVYSLDLSELQDLTIEPTTLYYWTGLNLLGISGTGILSSPYILPCIPDPVTTTPPFKVQLQGTANLIDICQHVDWVVQHKQASNGAYIGFSTPFVFGTPQNLIVDPDNEGDVLDPNPCPPESPCSIKLQLTKCGCSSTTFDFESNEIWVVYGDDENCDYQGGGNGGGGN
jgi:hypothetical protein